VFVERDESREPFDFVDPTTAEERALLSALSLADSSICVDDFFSPASRRLEFASPQKLQEARDVVKWCNENGATILYPGHLDYPEAFFRVDPPPLFLSVQGRPSWKNAKCLAVVGSREPSFFALNWLELHLPEIVRAGVITVSGGARGVDQKAHLISIRAKAPTVVFLPSGLASAYPAEWTSWRAELLASGGALVSPYSPYQQIRRAHFEGRNRLIAALASVVFIVEARRKSGSLMTARLATELDKSICVLPNTPGDPRWAGTVDLLFENRFPIRDAKDLISLLNLSR
jgi:DNA processing protein